jgi:DNA repair protein RecO (recombination protein O)
MASYVTDAIVIHTRRYGEADRLVTLFTHDRGRLTAIAKSSRKPQSRLRGASEPFVVARYEIAEGKSLDIIRSAEIIEPNLGLRDSWTRLQLAGHVAEIAGKITDERFPDPEFYELLSCALKGIADGDSIAVIRFKTLLLDHMGIFPNLTGCSSCGSGKVKGDIHIDVKGYGFLCHDCASESHVYHPVDMKVLYILTALKNRAELSESYEQAALDHTDDVLTILLQAFMQQTLKTVSATKHARTAINNAKNKSCQSDDTNTDIIGSEPESC